MGYREGCVSVPTENGRALGFELLDAFEDAAERVGYRTKRKASKRAAPRYGGTVLRERIDIYAEPISFPFFWEKPDPALTIELNPWAAYTEDVPVQVLEDEDESFAAVTDALTA